MSTFAWGSPSFPRLFKRPIYWFETLCPTLTGRHQFVKIAWEIFPYRLKQGLVTLKIGEGRPLYISTLTPDRHIGIVVSKIADLQAGMNIFKTYSKYMYVQYSTVHFGLKLVYITFNPFGEQFYKCFLHPDSVEMKHLKSHPIQSTLFIKHILQSWNKVLYTGKNTIHIKKCTTK